MDTKTKYVESGTGQVGYLYPNKATGTWVFDLFTGGPSPYQRTGEWPTKDEALAFLREHEFSEASE